ncbi:MAG: hypothetical protein QM709_13710 [Spongiibacteraceae bacterium]
MIRLSKAAALLLSATFSLLMTLTACTPEYTRKQGENLAGQARLLDSVAVERQNQRLLSRQAQVCLASADGGEETGADLLRTIQRGFTGYFLTVGVSGESIDYLRAVSGASCPGASYLFYIQPSAQPACDRNQSSCAGATSRYVITVIGVSENTLIDRINFSVKNSFLPLAANERERKQKAFEQLAIVLTGSQ